MGQKKGGNGNIQFFTLANNSSLVYLFSIELSTNIVAISSLPNL